jgi:hypothetical protein
VGIRYCLCPLSPKRLALLEEDPGLVEDLNVDDVPGMIDLGPSGFGLDGILLFAGKNPVIRDAVFAHSGRELGEPGDTVRVHSPERVLEVHQALSALPPDVISRHYENARKAIPQLERGPAAIAQFAGLFEQLCEVYATAAESGHSMLTFLV